MSRIKEYKTSNLAVAPYLSINGLDYKRSEVSLGKYDRVVVSFVFEDPKGIGKDLEMDYMKSEFKQYRDMSMYFRGEIEKLKRQIDYVQLKEQRKSDEKYIDENFDKKESKNG